MNPEEAWRSVAEAPDYQVSSLGRVLSTRRVRNQQGRILNGWLDKKGYRKVFLYNGAGQRVERFVHAIVAEAFHGPRPVGSDTRHLDGDKTNNAASNVRFGTRSENELDKVKHGTHQNARKTHCPAQHPYSVDNTYVTPRGERECRTCRREAQQRHAARAAGVSTERAA